jgi:hypothetical protein
MKKNADFSIDTMFSVLNTGVLKIIDVIKQSDELVEVQAGILKCYSSNGF